jgi:hypothetical protein
MTLDGTIDPARQDNPSTPEGKEDLAAEALPPDNRNSPNAPALNPSAGETESAITELAESLPLETHQPPIRAEELDPSLSELHCPRCGHSLRGVQEAGLEQCPECGIPFSFAQLRRRTTDGQDVGGFWRLFPRIMWGPNAFLTSLDAPRYYLRLRRPDRYNVAGLAAVLVSVLVGPIVGWLSGEIIISVAGPFGTAPLGRTTRGDFGIGLAFLLSWALAMFLSHTLTGYWIQALLRQAGHKEPRGGAQRVMFFAGVVYTAIALSGALCVFAVPAYVVLWFFWAWVVMRAFQAETRGLDTMLAPLALLNPGLVIAFLGPLAILLYVVLG